MTATAARTLTVVHADPAWEAADVSVTAAGVTDRYAVERVRRGQFLVSKFGGRRYHTDTVIHECTCPGSTYRPGETCRHIALILKLVELDRLAG